MSEFVEEDWKLKAHAEVKLRRENTNMLVSLSYVQHLNYTDKTNWVIPCQFNKCLQHDHLRI